MARILRFRAWLPEKKEMFYQNDQYLQSFLRRANYLASGMEHDTYAEGKVELEQWTGLTDKNGKEIYEGDVLQQKEESGCRWEVVWYDEDGKWWLNAIGENGFGSDNLWTFAQVTQVIGNIHTSPDLLTK